MKKKIEFYLQNMNDMQKFILFLHFFLFFFLFLYVIFSSFTSIKQTINPQQNESLKPPSQIKIEEETREDNQSILAPNPSGSGTGGPKEPQYTANTLEEMKLYVLDTGNSDCSLLLLPDGTTILFDVGDRDDGEAIVNAMNKYGVNHLDALVIGHFDSDHFGGTIDVLEACPTNTIYAPRIPDAFVPTTKIYQNTIQYLVDNNYRAVSPSLGTTIASGKDYRVYFLNSTNDGATWPGSDQNGYSLVVMIEYGKNKFLITSDALVQNEKEILSQWSSSDLDVDFLKVGHHCSKTSTSEEWLDKIKPEYAICTCSADNGYGHPHQVILNRLERHGAKVYRSDTDGTVLVTSNGQELDITTNLASADGSRN